jgi:hypothetical protein
MTLPPAPRQVNNSLAAPRDASPGVDDPAVQGRAPVLLVGAGRGESRGEERSPDRLALRLDEIAAALSRRAIERERSAGRLPRPDRTIGRMPLWRVETIRDWLGGGAR